MSDPWDFGEVDRIVARTGTGREAVLPILRQIQERYHYLPEEALKRVCEKTEITPAGIVGVATFYKRFRHRPAGRHRISVCAGTACHVKGADLVDEEIRRRLRLEPGSDTDAEREFTLERVGCLGCCTLAPVVRLDEVTHGHVTPASAGPMLEGFLRRRASGGPREEADGSPERGPSAGVEIRIGQGSCCLAGGAFEVRRSLERAAAEWGADVRIKPVGCVGMCHQIPLVEVVDGTGASTLYTRVRPETAVGLLARHVRPRGIWGRTRARLFMWLHRFASGGDGEPDARFSAEVRDPQICEFLGPQKRIATEHSGQGDPLSVEDYERHGGFQALRSAVAAGDPEAVIREISASGLRGRGGAGFPTGAKWAAARAAPGSGKVVIMNGDEGDPGAFMDRMLMESYPYRVLEGLAIAAYAVGASEGVLYIRSEYPLAIRRMAEAAARMEAGGLLGARILGSGFAFHVRVVEGAGAFVCGEETALLASVEGRRGHPRYRPPFPVERGLGGRPTVINNVETLACVPWILRHGAAAFAALGRGRSRGTKVFALAGKARRGGLIEVPMGTTLREIVERIGGGVAPGRTFKAVQIGGPSGGCIPATLADLPVDYEALTEAGAMMGSGGLIVLDDTDCMVDVALYFTRFLQEESCGQCAPCRLGTRRLRDILERLVSGRARKGDLARLETLAHEVRAASLCGLGKTAPNPVLTTLRYFREEYEAHEKGRCPAGKCKALVRYAVREGCIGCTRCAQACPSGAIGWAPYRRHEIDPNSCVKCDLCREVCPVGAVEIGPCAPSVAEPAHA